MSERIELRGTRTLWGRQGENAARVLCVSVQELLEEWPEGGPAAAFKRADETAYAHELVYDEDAGEVQVTLTSVDTAVPGVARLELSWIDAGMVKKTRIYEGEIKESINNLGEVPDPEYDGLIEQLGTAAARAEAARAGAEAAENAAEDAKDEAVEAKDAAEAAAGQADQSATSAGNSARAAQAAAEEAERVQELLPDPEQVNSLVEDVDELKAKAMVYKILSFDGSKFTDETGAQLSFSQIKTLCLDSKHFVYCSYENDLYIPQHIQSTQIYFDATYVRNHKVQIHRIGINANQSVNQEVIYPADSTELEQVKDDYRAQEQRINDLDLSAVHAEQPAEEALTEVPEMDEFNALVAKVDALPKDIQINGASILNSGVANIPFASVDTLGVVKTGNNIELNTGGSLRVKVRTADQFITDNNYCAIGNGTLKNVLSSPSSMPELSAQEQIAARNRIQVYGGIMQLICQVTFDEDAQGVDIRLDSNGNEFDLSYAFVVAQCPTGKVMQIQNLGFAYNRGSAVILARLQFGSATAPTSNGYCCGQVYQEKGYWLSRYSYIWQTNTTVNSMNTMSGLTYYARYPVNTYKSIQKVFNTSAATIPAGAKITVYGVRL